MSVDSRAPQRRPLSDQTSTVSSAAPASSASPLSSSSSSKPPPSTLLKSSQPSSPPKRPSRDPENPRNLTNASDDARNSRNVPRLRRTPALPARISPAFDFSDSEGLFSYERGPDDCKVGKSTRVCNPKRPIQKKKCMKEPITFPLLDITDRNGYKFNEAIEDIGLSKYCTIPLRKPKMHQRRQEDSVYGQDYIEQQRAYFSEIDAFQLPEEEATSSDSE